MRFEKEGRCGRDRNMSALTMGRVKFAIGPNFATDGCGPILRCMKKDRSPIPSSETCRPQAHPSGRQPAPTISFG